MKRELSEQEAADADRLRRWLLEMKRERGLTQSDVAGRLGMTQGALWQYANGRTKLNVEFLMKLNSAFGVNPWEISPDIGQKFAQMGIQATVNEVVMSPNAGAPEDPLQDCIWIDVCEPIHRETSIDVDWAVRSRFGFNLPRDYLRRYAIQIEACRAIVMPDESMEPLLMLGDVTVVNLTQRQMREARIYAMFLGEQLLIKQIFRQADGVTLHSLNALHPDKQVGSAELDRLRILGEVFYRAGPLL